MEEVNKTEYKISKHAEERYAERIMDKDNKNDINRFIVENREKIKTDINKMVEYGELIFIGKSNKEGRNKPINVYLQNCWVILVDEMLSNVVTLYKIDLGLDEEFNKAYISKMMEKLNSCKKVLEDTQLELQIESNTYRELINDAESQIHEYKSMIKNLEEMCTGYRTILDNNSVKITQANRDVAEVVNTMIGKKEF